MYSVLFMPLLQIPSGHHHVADCIKDQLLHSSEDFHCKKVELLSHCYGKLETFISNIYLQGIHKIPNVYSQIYKTLAVKGKTRNRYYLYERLFLKKVSQIIEEVRPDIIICTHALPSYLINRLKETNHWNGIVINAYTDYFINDLWGIKNIDFHFVPSVQVKQELLKRGVLKDRISITGIPVHPIFKEQTTNSSKNKDKWTFLISGGNMGAGSMRRFIDCIQPSGAVVYKVLCGKNKRLFQTIDQLNHPHIKALPYLHSKEEMNRLYIEADAIITKPGGVTISECIWRRIPTFVYEALPGQEEFNLNYLKEQGMVFHLTDWESDTNIENIMMEMFHNRSALLYERLDKYHNDMDDHDIIKLLKQQL